MFHGWVPEIIDHIDRDKGNNRVENLREATSSLNTQNSGTWRSNTSGYKNIYAVGTRYYVLYLGVYYGAFEHLPQAIECRDKIITSLEERDSFRAGIEANKTSYKKIKTPPKPPSATKHIYWDRSREKYCVKIWGVGHIGRFKTLEEAIEARDSTLLQIEIDSLDL
jgi:hypothetical protein